MTDILWLNDVEDHDYPAAFSYLSLIYDQEDAESFVKHLRSASISQFHVKDIFRASGLALLDMNNYHVRKDTSKIKQGKKLSPILLVRDTALGKVVIADGYHRICAVYEEDEDAMIPCKIV